MTTPQQQQQQQQPQVYTQEPYAALSSFESSFSGGSSSETDSRGGSTISSASSKNTSNKKRMEKSDPKLLVTPWYPDGISKNKVTIDDELIALHALLQLRPEESSRRHITRSALQEIVQKVWPDATVKIYGSFAYGLSLPHSHLDLVCEDCREIDETSMKNVFQRMEEAGMTVQTWTTTEACAFATVKMSFGCVANISFVIGKSTARKSVSEVRRLTEQFPSFGIVFAVVRLVLQQSRCSDARTGGLPSYAILIMLLHACYRSRSTQNPVTLLIDFFKMYSSTPGNNEALFIEDPLCPDNNLAAGCTKMGQIRSMFNNCAMTLEKWTHNKWEGYRGRSPLSSIIAYDNLWRD